MDTKKAWLSKVPWSEVQVINQALCKQQGISYEVARTCEAVRQLWETSASRSLSLLDVVDLCRKCYEIGPFVCNNGNTFAAVARQVVDEWAITMPSVEAQIVRNTIGHYVVGMVSRKELQKILQHFQT